MERKVGEVFDFKGVKLQVKDTGDSCFCYGCYFYGLNCQCDETHYTNQTGECFHIRRNDDNNVIFVEVKDDKEKESKL